MDVDSPGNSHGDLVKEEILVNVPEFLSLSCKEPVSGWKVSAPC